MAVVAPRDPKGAPPSKDASDQANPSRREALVRLGAAAGVAAGVAAVGRKAWDQGGFGVAESISAQDQSQHQNSDKPHHRPNVRPGV